MRDANQSGSGSSESPEIAFCPERKQLLEAFCEATEQMTMLLDQQVTALIRGDEDFARFDLLIRMAHEQKDQAKYAYIAHVEKHGC